MLSSGLTVMNGAISARGGAHGGNGGTVEVSGNELGFTGTIDASAPSGAPGSVLFDPATLDIAGSTSPSTLTPGNVLFAQDSGSTDTVSATSLAGVNSNVTLQATSLLEVQNSVSFQHNVNVTLQSVAA